MTSSATPAFDDGVPRCFERIDQPVQSVPERGRGGGFGGEHRVEPASNAAAASPGSTGRDATDCWKLGTRASFKPIPMVPPPGA